MKKILLFFILLVTFLAPQLAMSALVPCGNDGQNPCTLSDFFVLIRNVYDFMVWTIALPIAGLMIMIGGILILISGGPGGANPITGAISPNLYSTAKNIITYSIIGVVLIFGSWLIIDAVLKAIGYTGV